MTFQRQPVRTSTDCDIRFILAMGRSHRLRVCRLQLVAHFGLAFATASCLKTLNLAADEQLAGSLCKRHAVSRLAEQAPHWASDRL